MTTSYPVLAKRTNITGDRLMELSHGAEPTNVEIELLAGVWFVTTDGLLISVNQANDR